MEKKHRVDDEVFFVARAFQSLFESHGVALAAGLFHLSSNSVRRCVKKGIPPSLTVRKTSKTKAKRIHHRRALLLRLRKAHKEVRSIRYTPKLRKSRERVTKVRRFPSVYAMCRELNSTYNEKCSRTTVYNDLIAVGARARRLRKSPRLTTEHKRLRVIWCEKILKSPHILIAFTDECFLDDNEATGWCWTIGREEPDCCETDKFPTGRIMVWCLVCPAVRFIVAVSGTLDADQYVSQVLTPALPALHKANKAGYAIQEDGARCHKSASFFKRHHIQSIDFPPKSPDISLVENVFGIVKPAVRRRYPYGPDELVQMMKEEILNITDDVLQKMWDGWRDRLRAVVRSRGAIIKPKRHPKKK